MVQCGGGGSHNHNVPNAAAAMLSLSPVVSLKDALEGLVATLEDYQGRFSELQRLEEAVRGLHRCCKVRIAADIFYSGRKYTEKDWVRPNVRHYPLQNGGRISITITLSLSHSLYHSHSLSLSLLLTLSLSLFALSLFHSLLHNAFKMMDPERQYFQNDGSRDTVDTIIKQRKIYPCVT